MVIKTADLINIQNIAKSFKQKDFVIYNGSLYSVTNLGYLARVSIPYIGLEYNNLVFNYKELSDFVKTIVIESEFEYNGGTHIINDSGTILPIRILTQLQYDALIAPMDQFVSTVQYGDITDEIEVLKTMKTADGTYFYNKDNKYYMTLFPGMLPTNKSDKIHLVIADYGNTFVAVFSVVKKKEMTINIMVKYLKV
jgi:hypothetical protein